MKIASDGTTLCRWNPKVGATSVEDDLEALWWGADSNLGEVCIVISSRLINSSGVTYTERSRSC